jgi:Leucine-rich repeat (LRR) protein
MAASIVSITGLQNLPNLTNFNAGSNSLQSVNLSGLTNLTNVDLGNNNITLVDNITLPNSLQQLDLGYNQIVTFNPAIALPSGLQQLGLGGNQMTTAGYTASEPWANAMSVIPGRGNMYFTDNIDSISGTNLETILITKGWNVIA